MLLSGALCGLLTGCGDGLPSLPGGGESAGAALDARAIEAGIIPDPRKSDLAGRYETRGDIGVDKLCAVKKSSGSFDIGFLSVSGSESKCEGTGSARINGEKVEIILNGQADCKFTARYDGFELRFPAVVDSGCAQYCSDRASFSGTHYFMVEPGNSAARDTLGRDIERLCS
ncbi:MAG: hypothetical protein ACK4S7_12635 [Sphingorhabdus sp.]